MPEGREATLTIAHESDRVGTWNLITCVGLYFKVDDKRYFIAHINAENALTYSMNVITKDGGEWIAKKVKQKLFEFRDRDDWNTRDYHFGQDLYVQCSELDDIERDGKMYQRVGRYVVQGIYDFLASSSQALLEDAGSCKTLKPKRPEGIQKASSRKLKIKRLEAKAQSLKDLSARAEVMSTKFDHGFVMVPSTSRVTTLKGPKYESTRDLGDYTPIAEPAAEEGSFYVKLLEDDLNAFPKSLINRRAAEMIAKRQNQGKGDGISRNDGL